MKDETVKDIRERTFEFACRIVNLHQTLQKKTSIGVLLTQLLRSGTAIGSNLQEAEAGQSKPDFISKNRIALKEARETLYWLRILASTKVVSAKRLEPLTKEADELVAILTTIVRHASTSRSR
jgi:four helix bundle protein